ncbi:MAG: hypothetical protein IT367_20215 [Candidatus Hydrogenedentes bacterium]|nr:hypothetical protein [Candidatus Hydrogenedentota bacterium]
MKEYAPGSISWQISNVLRERYPDGVAETGAWTQIAGEFGATRELVRQVAANLGIERRNKVRMVRVCASCGNPPLARGQSLYCADCVKIPLACEWCGKLRYEYVRVVLRRYDNEYNAQRRAAGLPSYKTGMTFCSTQCSWRYRGKHYGWGNPDHPNNAHRGEHGRVTQYQQGCRCDACKAASREYYGNKYKENPEYREKVLARGRAYYARKKAERAAART